MSKLRLLTLTLVALTFAACSDAQLTAHKREAAFFDRFVNPSGDFRAAEANLESVKLLENDDTYPMRIALFEGGKLYYQVDELGDGYGYWERADGMLKIYASRPRFEMKMGLSGLGATGENAAIKFLDRHGLNTVELKLRDGSIAGRKLAPLRAFTYSDKNI